MYTFNLLYISVCCCRHQTFMHPFWSIFQFAVAVMYTFSLIYISIGCRRHLHIQSDLYFSLPSLSSTHSVRSIIQFAVAIMQTFNLIYISVCYCKHVHIQSDLYLAYLELMPWPVFHCPSSSIISFLHLLPNHKSDWAEIWWESSQLHRDWELLK